MNLLKAIASVIMTLILLGGCASDSQIANSIIERGVDAEIAALNLPRISSEYLEVNPEGQLVSRRAAIFKGSDGLPYLAILEKPLFQGSSGREVSLDEPTIRIGYSSVRVSRYSEWENELFKKNQFSIKAGLDAKKSKVKIAYVLRDEEHAQEVGQILQRLHRR